MKRLAFLLLAACAEPSTPATASAPAVKCSVERGVRCDCDTRDSPSGQEVACSAKSLGDPATCCSDESFASEKVGGCSCVAFGCERTVGMCRCGPITSSGGERVTSCTPAASEQCCVDAKKRRCVCGPDPCEGSVVTDCSLARIEKTCQAQFNSYRAAVPSCRD